MKKKTSYSGAWTQLMVNSDTSYYRLPAIIVGDIIETQMHTSINLKQEMTTEHSLCKEIKYTLI